MDLAELYTLQTRPDLIFVGARRTGKTTLLSQTDLGASYVFDDNGQLSDEETVAAIKKLLTQYNALPPLRREQAKPIIMLRSSTWGRIHQHFWYWKPTHVADFAFPGAAFPDMLTVSGMPSEVVEGYFGVNWHKKFYDSNNKFLPELAWATARRTAVSESGYHSGKALAIAQTGADYLKAYYPEELFFLVHLAPSDRKYWMAGTKVTLSKSRVIGRLISILQTSGRKLPYGMTYPKFFEYLEISGIWKENRKGFFALAPAYGAGVTYLKNRLTLERTADILSL